MNRIAFSGFYRMLLMPTLFSLTTFFCFAQKLPASSSSTPPDPTSPDYVPYMLDWQTVGATYQNIHTAL